MASLWLVTGAERLELAIDVQPHRVDQVDPVAFPS